MDELVTSLKEVVDNITKFNKDLEDNTEIISQLTMFRHWYYIPELNVLGPSKYIGYKNMNTSKYDRVKRKTGVDTKKILKEGFIKLPVESKKGQKINGTTL
ncbi:hypothetical protein P9D43_30200 [Neobacillus niacini]|uniref:hypothetical protein n=1 Tax=Neobacillus niacini TaxID=86668 RepID=UPI00068A4291|nr:hypothetical protein [Neobacillus niacini]MEC1526243.1 hypothetical protein [Neobacillus niacini]